MPSSTFDFAIENVIAEQWSPGTGSERVEVFNPSDAQVVATFTSSSRDDVDGAVAAARAAQPA